MASIFNQFFLFSLLSFTSMTHAELSPTQMPNDFVKLRDVDPRIIESQRYAGSENFLGRPVSGYNQVGIYCTKQTALALKKVNSALRRKGYTLVVYDAYRPQRAVNAFVEWSKSKGDKAGKALYYPSIEKNKLFHLHYLLARSGHSRGSTVDLTIIPLKQDVKPITVSYRQLNNSETIPFLDDNTADMGSSFDLFHPVSHYSSQLITKKQAQMRELLHGTMETYGFTGVVEEWWHYTLANEPYPNTYFDFLT